MNARGDSPTSATSGWPKRTLTERRCGRRAPGGNTSHSPSMRTGRTGTRACTATSPTPALNGGHLAGSAAGSLGEDHDAPAIGEQPLDRVDGSAPRPIRRKGTAANHDTSKRYARRWNQ